MKAAVVTAPKTVECQQMDKPVPKAGEVLVQVAYCGLCGSDIPRVLQGSAHYYPIVLGHEFSGRIVDIGDDVDASLLGTRVAGVPLIPCMKCAACKKGTYSLCSDYVFIGSRVQGAFAEYVCVPAANVYSISETTPYLQAAFFEPASVAAHGVELADFQPDATAVVAGCGTIGIFTAQLLKGRGARMVVGLDCSEQRIEVARGAGIDTMLNTFKSGWREQLAALVEGGADYVFDTSGNSQMMAEDFGLAANRATVCYIGTPRRDVTLTAKQWEYLNRKELTVRGTWMSYSAPFPGKEWQCVADGFSDATLHVTDEMIDTIYDLADFAECFERIEKANDISGKLLAKCSNL